MKFPEENICTGPWSYICKIANTEALRQRQVFLDFQILGYTFFHKKNIYKKMHLKKMLRKSPAQMPDLQFLETLIFAKAF